MQKNGKINKRTSKGKNNSKPIITKRLLVKTSSKAQSAMEYLMTYGWAILIIAVVLAVFFQLGVFNSSLPNACLASSGYYCQNPTLSTTGVLSLTIGQSTGQTLYSTYVLFDPSGASLSQSASAYIGTLQSGQAVNINIKLPNTPPYPQSYTIGTTLTGYIYLAYYLTPQSTAVDSPKNNNTVQTYDFSGTAGTASTSTIPYESNQYIVKIATLSVTVNKIITTTSTTSSPSTTSPSTTVTPVYS
jgi:hypothetical protein